MTQEILKRIKLVEGSQTRWAMLGSAGAVEFWVFSGGDELGLPKDTYGGVEMHYTKATAPEYLNPINVKCSFVEDCHHEGSSSWADEHWIPSVLPLGDEVIFRELGELYTDTFRKEATL